MDEEVCSALEAAEEARALLPALLSAFDNHQVFPVMMMTMMMMMMSMMESRALLSAFDNHQVLPALDGEVKIVKKRPPPSRQVVSTSCWTLRLATRRMVQSG